MWTGPVKILPKGQLEIREQPIKDLQIQSSFEESLCFVIEHVVLRWPILLVAKKAFIRFVYIILLIVFASGGQMKRVPTACSIQTVRPFMAPSRVKTSCLVSRLPSRPLSFKGFSVIIFYDCIFTYCDGRGLKWSFVDLKHLIAIKYLLEPQSIRPMVETR